MNRKALIKELELNAAKGRQNVLRMVKASDHGHLGGALSSMDIVTALYFYKMKVDPENPAWEDRDRFCSLPGTSAWSSMQCWRKRAFLTNPYWIHTGL